MSSSPILLLGASTPVRTRIHEVLVAAGYPVVIAESPAEALRLAAEALPRAVVAPVDAAEDWRRLVHPFGEHFQQTLPVLVISQDSVGMERSSSAPRPVVCREPGFGRQLLGEIQYVERTFPSAPAPAGGRGSRIGMIPISPWPAAPL